MKQYIIKARKGIAWFLVLLAMVLLQIKVFGQVDTTATSTETVAEEEMVPTKIKPVKNTFQSVWIIDNQTVMVPIKKTLEMDIMHRFGTWKNGYKDFWGFFAPSNIRIGFSYVPINKLNVGIGFSKTTASIIPHGDVSSVAGPFWDASAKYSLFTQTKGKYPVSLTYYANVGFNTKKDNNKEIYRYTSDRLNYFHQLIIARKVTEKLSVQIAPSLSHQNVVNGYFTKVNDSTLEIKKSMNHEHFAVALSARYKLTPVTSVMFNYDQPITKHATNNPNPSLSFGVEFNTSSHAFQIFFTNYYFLVPQVNNLYNNNSPFKYTDVAGNEVEGGKFLIGFNITRLWNY